MTDQAETGKQATRFLLLYALAVAGGAVAYVPFLTILLPLQVTELAGDADINWLAYIAFAGAIIASGSNILFGWLSDRVRNRRIWVWSGLITSSTILIAFSAVGTFWALLAFIIVWQIALNMMLSPLAAWAGDSIPDGPERQVGRIACLRACTRRGLRVQLLPFPGWLHQRHDFGLLRRWS